jgi:hypothetical protein
VSLIYPQVFIKSLYLSHTFNVWDVCVYYCKVVGCSRGSRAVCKVLDKMLIYKTKNWIFITSVLIEIELFEITGHFPEVGAYIILIYMYIHTRSNVTLYRQLYIINLGL